MTFNSKTRRRWFGALCLLAAIAMLVAGETVLKGRLSTPAFLAWWLTCFVLTALAIGAALLDARALRQESREEQRALFESTLEKIKEQNTKNQTPKTKETPYTKLQK